MYDNGIMVPRDYSEAGKWYRKAAEQGDIVAKLESRLAARIKRRCRHMFSEGTKWFRRAVVPG